MEEQVKSNHFLLTALGVNARENTYSLHGRSITAKLAPIALLQLIHSDPPMQVKALVTAEANEKTWPLFKEEVRSLTSKEPERLDVPDGKSAEEVQKIIETAAHAIPAGASLTLDVTQGIRHFPFILYALALYLQSLRNVQIRGAYYGMEMTSDTIKPIVDLLPLLELPHWFHAVRVFRETGSLREVARSMEAGEKQELVFELSQYFLTGMPLEAGNAATRLLGLLNDEPLLTKVPLAREINEAILDEVRPLSGPLFEGNPKDKTLRKDAIQLTEEELTRQAEFIDRYFRTGQLNLAFGLLREWIVSRLALNEKGIESWLSRQSRESAERKIGGLGEVIKGKRDKNYIHASVRKQLSEDQKTWAKRWNNVCDIRNALQHHGMKPAVFQSNREDIRKAEQDWNQWQEWIDPPPFGGGQGRLLICPIGLTPGVLYSALNHVHPDRVLVVCSDSSVSAIDDALAKAGMAPEVIHLKMQNPHGGIGEFESLIDAASLWLFEADEVYANLTGGTTLMGVLVGELNKRAGREYQRTVREFVLIDHRSPEEQRNFPWVLGAIHYLDGTENLPQQSEQQMPDNTSSEKHEETSP